MSSHRRMQLGVHPDRFTLESLRHPGVYLEVDRRWNPSAPSDIGIAVRVDGDGSSSGPGFGGGTTVDLFFGIFTLMRGPYLCVVTRVASAGRFREARFYQVLEVDFLPFVADASDDLTAEQKRDEARYLSMLRNIFRTRAFYFAEGYDLTNTAQRTALAETRFEGASLWRGSDRRFWWNRHVLGPLIDGGPSGVDEWVVPVINGLVKVLPSVQADTLTFDMLFVSRRHTGRQGTRYNMRGLNADGEVANFVETEQVIGHADGALSSYVQTRGSIPIYWTQYVDMRYTPKVKFPASAAQTQVAFAAHADEQVRLYGRVTCINLIDKKGDQKRLGDAFNDVVSKHGSDRFTYVWFDFHRECRRMQWHNLSKLIDALAGDIERHGFFHATADGRVERAQQGVFRTNCLDNLDRTNVVQSLLGRRAAAWSLGRLADASDVLNTPFPLFEDRFKALWTDNANCLGLLYTGTGALKTDFTRTGKRTMAGACQDGWRSVVRYFLNNLVDGRVQDQWDLFLGRYAPTRGDRSPLAAARREETPQGFLTKCGLVFFGVTALVAAAAPGTVDWSSRLMLGTTVAALFMGAASYMQLKMGVGVGPRIVSKPHLCPHSDEK